jgi:hypothetical protein
LYAYRPLSSPFYLATNQRNMDIDAFTVSSLTTEPDNLTALHRESDLQGEHQTRRTETGFLI